jgi:diguanylate cyclase (GGDEF)-like protein
MTEFVDPSISRPRLVRKRIVSALIILVESGGFIGLTALLLSGRLMDALVVLQLMLAVALPVTVMWATVRRHRNWHQPLGQLQELIPQVRDGVEPIESLGKVGGKLATLAAVCQQMLRDIREEKLRIAQLEEEVRQRIASRTEVLERRIGALRQQAARDGLTGLFNRRALDDYLPEAIERCKAAGTPLCVLMIDIDNFKPLNDTLGHAAGDQMLKSLSQLIRSTIREGDVAFRNGGDEFVVVMEDCAPETGQSLAQRISSLGGDFGKTFRVKHPPELSIGIANLDEVREANAQVLLRAADQALYRMKTTHHAATGAPARKRSA